MTVSIRVMTAGQGYRYLLNSVVVGDGDRDAATALTRYYEQSGTPPGRWYGSGLDGLAEPIGTAARIGDIWGVSRISDCRCGLRALHGSW
ncbi:hypothetical protein CJ197_14440 [Brachybacterium sp. UMB0905]|nr:hypothetical protein CJ197_14440 [Brachybacterium sp. UMB0905]